MKYLKKTEYLAKVQIVSFVATDEKKTVLIRINDQTPGQFEINLSPGSLSAAGYEEITEQEFSKIYHAFGVSFFQHLDHLNIQPKSSEA